MTKHSLYFSIIALVSLVNIPHAQADVFMPVTDSKEVESKVFAAFPNAPVMIAIAKCESGIRQFNKDGSVVRGGVGGQYIGIFQIGEGHIPQAQKQGLDIYTVDGNIAYAKYLYDRSGAAPWAPCVPGEAPAQVPTTPVIPANASVPPMPVNPKLTVNLSFGYTHPEVVTLQQILNAKGFAIAPTGPGSPGLETAKFGLLTREALRKFQCSIGIACSGSESSTGYGRLGPMTRAALLK